MNAFFSRLVYLTPREGRVMEEEQILFELDNRPGTTDTSVASKLDHQVDFLGHCIFCLRKTTEEKKGFRKRRQISDELLDIVPAAQVLSSLSSSSSTTLLSTFNRIWWPLQLGREEGEMTNLPFGFLEWDGSKASSKRRKLT